jgi:DNA-binding NtrC family response regulator
MPLTLVLAVGMDSALLAGQRPIWQSAGYFVTHAGSIREAIVQLRDGDFDLVLLFHSIPAESRERLTFLIRSSGMRIPVVCVVDSSSDHDSFADATFRNEPDHLLRGIGELFANRSKTHLPRTAVQSSGRC